jgi:hypothetical protein
MFLHDIVAPLTIDEAKATKTRLDPKCWKGKKIGNPKTKVKGGVRVNNCVPIEEDIGPDKNDPWEQGWRANPATAYNPYEQGTPEYAQWEEGQAERQAQPNHYDESVAEATGDVKFDKMLKGITGKKEIAKQNADPLSTRVDSDF